MRGLITKDLLCLKSQMKNLLFIVLGFIILSTVSKDYSLIAFVLPFYFVMILVSTFSYDEYNNFNGYSNTFPLTRKQIVKAKYVLVFFGLLLSALVGLSVSFGINAFDKSLKMEELLATITGGIFGISIVISTLIPFFYKYGLQKGRMMLFAVIIGFSLLFGILVKLLGNFNIDVLSILYKIDLLGTVPLIIICLVIITLILFVSYLASCHIYEHKEF